MGSGSDGGVHRPPGTWAAKKIVYKSWFALRDRHVLAARIRLQVDSSVFLMFVFFQRFFVQSLVKVVFRPSGRLQDRVLADQIMAVTVLMFLFWILFFKTAKSKYRFVCLYSWASKCRPGPRRFGTAGPWQSRVSHFWMFLFWNVFFGQSCAKIVFRPAWRLQPSQAKRSHRPASRPYTP